MSRVLIAEMEAYCAATGTPQTVLGKVALNDLNLLRRLRDGRRMRPENIERVRAAMRAHPTGMRLDRAGVLVHAPAARKAAGGDEAPPSFFEADKFRTDAAIGSRELLRAMLRLGVRMGGLPGLDAETFGVRCAAFGIGGKRGAAR